MTTQIPTEKSRQLLSKATKFLVNQANAEGLNLQEMFGTVERFQQFVISLTLKTLIDAGIEVEKAYDIVLGEGNFQRLTDEVWAQNQLAA